MIRRLLSAVIRRTPLHPMLLALREKNRRRRELREWETKGRPVPPPHIVKQRVLLDYAARYKLNVLVETGTFLGDMVEAMKSSFRRIYSIELSKNLYAKARQRFAQERHIHLIQGDSGKELLTVLKELQEPALFWLDGHFSSGITARGDKDTPIFDELNHILTSSEMRHVIIIDDARCFGSDPAYPALEELVSFIRLRRPAVDIEVKDDSIRICPKGKSTKR